MGGAHPPARACGLRHHKGDQAGLVAGHVIFAAGHKAPALGLGQGCETRLLQPPGTFGHRVEGGEAFFDVSKQILMDCHNSHSSLKKHFSAFDYTAAGRCPSMQPCQGRASWVQSG